MEDQARFRRHKGACPFYRENWINSGDPVDPREREVVLYEIYCLKDTPPITAEEQDRCMHSPRECWRLAAKQQATHTGTKTGPDRTKQPAGR